VAVVPPFSRSRATFLVAPAILLAAWLAPLAHAQLLADVMMSTAIAAQFDPGLRLPSGTLRAVGSGTEGIIARVPDRDHWTDWEVYDARGLAAKLQGAYVHQIETAFAVAGYFESGRTQAEVGPETRTHIVFEGDNGERLLYVITTSQEVVWLTARSH